jgi:hypothetical protein
MNTNGAIFYEGPSNIDGVQIVGVITGLDSASKNSKTRDMLQTFILLRNTAPNIAIKNGEDISICGGCKHRFHAATDTEPERKRACYVIVHQAPLSVWRCYKRGNYGALDYSIIAGRQLRLGSYGDPAAIPLAVWNELKTATGIAAHTGYTHQWQNKPEYGALCMASVDSEKEFDAARLLGLRTFRVRSKTESLLPGEFVCPASEEGHHRTTCDHCGLCNGLESKTDRTPVIFAHGAFAVNFQGEKI